MPNKRNKDLLKRFNLSNNMTTESGTYCQSLQCFGTAAGWQPGQVSSKILHKLSPKVPIWNKWKKKYQAVNQLTLVRLKWLLNWCVCVCGCVWHVCYINIYNRSFANTTQVNLHTNSVDQELQMITRMCANAQRDGRPAKHSWHPLFNAAKFGWRPLLDAVQ